MVDEQLLADSIEAMKEIGKDGGGEDPHFDADLLLCEVLTRLGYGALVDEYHKIQPKWYA